MRRRRFGCQTSPYVLPNWLSPDVSVEEKAASYSSQDLLEFRRKFLLISTRRFPHHQSSWHITAIGRSRYNVRCMQNYRLDLDHWAYVQKRRRIRSQSKPWRLSNIYVKMVAKSRAQRLLASVIYFRPCLYPANPVIGQRELSKLGSSVF